MADLRVQNQSQKMAELGSILADGSTVRYLGNRFRVLPNRCQEEKLRESVHRRSRSTRGIRIPQDSPHWTKSFHWHDCFSRPRPRARSAFYSSGHDADKATRTALSRAL